MLTVQKVTLRKWVSYKKWPSESDPQKSMPSKIHKELYPHAENHTHVHTQRELYTIQENFNQQETDPYTHTT